jgi:hypothetical protein
MKQSLVFWIIIVSVLFVGNTFVWLVAQGSGHHIPAKTQWFFGTASFLLMIALIYLVFWKRRRQPHVQQTKALQHIIHLLSLVEEKITDDSDMTWTAYPDAETMRNELAGYRQKLEQEDFSVLPALRLLFAPTGSLQEFAMSNGWGREYLDLADTFDALLKRI